MFISGEVISPIDEKSYGDIFIEKDDAVPDHVHYNFEKENKDFTPQKHVVKNKKKNVRYDKNK